MTDPLKLPLRIRKGLDDPENLYLLDAEHNQLAIVLDAERTQAFVAALTADAENETDGHHTPDRS